MKLNSLAATDVFDHFLELVRKIFANKPTLDNAVEFVTSKYSDESSIATWQGMLAEVCERYLPEDDDKNSDLISGDVIDSQYRIDDGISKNGAFKAVYKAMDLKVGNRVVALKFYRKELKELFEIFIKPEIWAQAGFSHPNVVTLFDYKLATDEKVLGRWYLVEEYIEGETLRDRINRKPDFNALETMEIATGVVQGLCKIHQAGRIHSDLKPDNILILDNTNTAKITDFGVSQSLDATSFLRGGTTEYNSPEFINNEPLDPRTDIWSFGVLLYELITGKFPFSGHDAKEKITSAEPVPISQIRPECPRKLQKIVLRCLQKDRNKRYHNSSELLKDLSGGSAFRRTEVIVTGSVIFLLTICTMFFYSYWNKSSFSEAYNLGWDLSAWSAGKKTRRCPGEAPDHPVFNIDPVTYRDGAETQVCSDFPLIDVALDTTNPQFSRSKNDLEAIRQFDVGNNIAVLLYMHNGAANNLSAEQTTAKNVLIETSIKRDGNIYTLRANFLADNASSRSESVQIRVNDDEELRLITNSGYAYNVKGVVILDMQNIDLGDSTYLLGDLDAGWEYSLFFSYKLKLVKKSSIS